MMQYNLTEPEMQYISFVRIISRFQAHCSLGNFVGFCCFGWKIGFLFTVMGCIIGKWTSVPVIGTIVCTAHIPILVVSK